ncbi:MAG: response regulator transcription factor [Dyadobacter sp.]|uniref:LytR/AlgR family response regulator transcription factor n=1 Tax=Dyadobacter sp. TaxID=1914288 RepID=UPI001B13804F|nr:LytTR family DNA-binding domain-containing protein [Dyadobacter sp.]MBO9611144.1 response regulator transcription factor [Dyadobacter sp.]
MKLKCLVVDDEPLAAEILEAHIERIPSLHLEKVCTSAIQALDFLAGNQVDLLFLDIEMPVITGLQFLRMVKQLPPVILTTAYSEFALEAFELEVVDYLQKPIAFERMLAAVNKVRHYISMKQAVDKQQAASDTAFPDLFVKCGSKIVRVPQNEILFIEGKKEYVLIRTLTREIKTTVTIRELSERLPAQLFIRVHRSFIASLSKVDSIDRAGVWIGETRIPIGDIYREPLLKRILN